MREKFDFDIEARTVFDIPIVLPYFGFRLLDEVRLFARDPQTAMVTPDLWAGIVCERDQVDRAQSLVAESGLDRRIPIFSPDCRLIGQLR